MSNFFDKGLNFGNVKMQAPPPAPVPPDTPMEMKEHVRSITPLVNAIDRPIAMGDKAAAEARCKELEAFLIDFAGKGTHPDVTRFLSAGYFELGSAFRRMNNVPQAEVFYAKAAVLLEKITQVQRHAQYAGGQLAAGKNQLGLLYMECGPQDKAIASLGEAIAMRRALAVTYPDDYPNLVYLGGAICNRAHIAAANADNPAATQMYDEAIAIFDNVIPKCDCGCQEAMVGAMSAAMKHPHWIMMAHQFRANAENGKRSLNS